MEAHSEMYFEIENMVCEKWKVINPFEKKNCNSIKKGSRLTE